MFSLPKEQKRVPDLPAPATRCIFLTQERAGYEEIRDILADVFESRTGIAGDF